MKAVKGRILFKFYFLKENNNTVKYKICPYTQQREINHVNDNRGILAGMFWLQEDGEVQKIQNNFRAYFPCVYCYLLFVPITFISLSPLIPLP